VEHRELAAKTQSAISSSVERLLKANQYSSQIRGRKTALSGGEGHEFAQGRFPARVIT
jgi:hypothetical protein